MATSGKASLGLWCLVALCAIGCAKVDLKPPSWPWAKKPAAEEPSAKKTDPEEARKLRTEIETLKADKRTLEAKIQHLQRRQEDLAERARKLKFANDRLLEERKQLSLAPIDRDRYKALAEGLAIDVHRLKRENAALKDRLARLSGATTRPATGPATKPAKAPPAAPATRPARPPAPPAGKPVTTPAPPK